MKFRALTLRNIKLFFKDRGMFFASMMTPMILLVLYATFLGKVYTDSFKSSMPAGFSLSDDIISAMVGGELISSILAVCCVTVAFCSNMLMVQDKANGTCSDFQVAPVKSSTLSMSYYAATALSTLIVCFTALAVCLLYVRSVGWYMSAADVLLMAGDIVLLLFFGTALSSLVNIFLSTQGQISAVGTIVCAGYGFICGAYMPISQFGDGLQRALSFLPGTYGTSLMRNHAMRGVFAQMSADGVPDAVLNGIKESVDCTLYFFDKEVTMSTMYLYLIASTVALVGIYILLNILRERKSV